MVIFTLNGKYLEHKLMSTLKLKFKVTSKNNIPTHLIYIYYENYMLN